MYGIVASMQLFFYAFKHLLAGVTDVQKEWDIRNVIMTDLQHEHVAALRNGGWEEALGEGGEQEGVHAYPAGALPEDGHPPWRMQISKIYELFLLLKMINPLKRPFPKDLEMRIIMNECVT